MSKKKKMSFNPQLEDPNNSGHELMRFSPSGEDKLKVMLNLLPPDFHPIMDQWIRVFVKEEIDFAQMNLLPTMNSGNKTSTSGSRSLQLQFKNRISPSVLTGKKIPINVELVDRLTGKIVDTGPEAAAELEIFALKVDRSGGEAECSTPEEVNRKNVRKRKGKKIVQGSTNLKLKDGKGSVGEISFTHNSEWTKNGKYKLGVRVVDAAFVTRVLEAKTESFLVKDHRNSYYEKHNPPSLSDDIWRLDKISKDGAYYGYMKQANITTMKHLIIHYINSKELKHILPDVPSKILEVILNHAIKCKGILLYRDPGYECKNGVVFDVKGQLMGIFNESQYLPIDKLSEDQKADAEKLVASACEHSKEVVSLDDETSLIGYLQSQFPSMESRNAPNLGSPQVIDRYDHTLPSTSTQVIKPSLNSIWDTNTLDNSDLHNSENLEFYHHNVFIPGQNPNIPDNGTPCTIERHEDDHTQPGSSSQVVKPPLHTYRNTNNFDNLDSSNIGTEDFFYDNIIVTGRTPDRPIYTPDNVCEDDELFWQILNNSYSHQSESPNIELHHPEQARCTIGILLVAALLRWIQVSKLRVSRRRRRNGIPEGIHDVQKRQRCC